MARAATGQEALAAPVPDVVLLDLRLPDMDGYDVCRKLRERSNVAGSDGDSSLAPSWTGSWAWSWERTTISSNPLAFASWSLASERCGDGARSRRPATRQPSSQKSLQVQVLGALTIDRRSRVARK